MCEPSALGDKAFEICIKDSAPLSPPGLCIGIKKHPLVISLPFPSAVGLLRTPDPSVGKAKGKRRPHIWDQGILVETYMPYSSR